MYISIVTVGKSMEVSQETKNTATICASNPTPGHIPRKDKNSNLKKYMSLNIQRSTIPTIAKTWKHPKHLLTDE